MKELGLHGRDHITEKAWVDGQHRSATKAGALWCENEFDRTSSPTADPLVVTKGKALVFSLERM